MMNSMKKENEHVRTAIRWRVPDADENNAAIIEKLDDKVLIFGNQRKPYTFDHVINVPDQRKLYEILVEPLVEKALEGYDCTFLASGQTGSGKTYTIGFENGASTNSENDGMTMRVLKYIFSCGKTVETYISFIEIYNDQAFDLLGQHPQEAFFKKDHRACEPTKKSVQSDHEVSAILARGTKNRRIRGTKMNSTSSRSHAVFTIYLKTGSSECKTRESVINLVDLAGSECVRKTGTTGDALAEGKSINESLSAFKRVLAAMSKGAKHIPFRDSLITFILRDSLKLDSYLTLLGCVSPLQRDYGETCSTLNFVAEAKQIKITPRLNAVIDESQKFNTPVKIPNSPFRSMKRSSSFITEQNKSSASKRLRSDKPNTRLTVGNSVSQRRLTTTTTNRQSTLNPTAKRLSLSTIRNTRSSAVGVKSTPLTNDVATSPQAANEPAPITMDCDVQRFDSSNEVGVIPEEVILPPANEDVLKIVKSLENVIREEIMSGKEINQATITKMIGQLKTKLNVQHSTIDVSFCRKSPLIQSPTLSTVTEVTEAVSEKDSNTDNSNGKIISTNCSLGTDTNYHLTEQVAWISSVNNPVNDLDPVVSVSKNYDHMENTIKFNVEEKYDDTATPIHSETQNTLQRNTDQWEAVRKCNSFVGTSLDENLTREDQRKSLHHSEDDAIEAIVSSTTIIDSPKLPKIGSDENVRTPIGKIIIRKVAPASEFECTQYAVEMVNRTRQPLDVMSPTGYSDFCVTPAHPSNKPPMSTAVRKNPVRRHLPLSPRVILHRIDQPNERQMVDRIRTTPRIKSTRAMGGSEKLKSKLEGTIDGRIRILGILNTGSEKDLQNLSKIGRKTAAQILNYRKVKGPLKRIEDLTKIGWSRNMCQKFIATNIFE